MSTFYEQLFLQTFACLPDQSKPLDDYSKDELIRFIHVLKDGLDAQHTDGNIEPTVNETTDDYGLAVVAATEADLLAFRDFCARNFLPLSAANCHVAGTCQQQMIDHYSATGINHRRTEYAMFVILRGVHCAELTPLARPTDFFINSRRYSYELQVLVQHDGESHDELLTRIRCRLLGEIFTAERDDHESIPSLPAPKEPQFVSIAPHTQIACWPLPRRRDLKRFRTDLGVTHMLTLLNDKELRTSNICTLIESAGMRSLHVPIEGAEVAVYASSQATVDVLAEHAPAIRDLLLNSTESAPVKMIIHCAAGLHRTGTITYLLMRMCQFNVDQALLIITRTRAITGRQVGKKRIDAAEHHLLHKISR